MRPSKCQKRGKNRKKSVQHKLHEGDTDDQISPANSIMEDNGKEAEASGEQSEN